MFDRPLPPVPSSTVTTGATGDRFSLTSSLSQRRGKGTEHLKKQNKKNCEVGDVERKGVYEVVYVESRGHKIPVKKRCSL